MLKRNPKNLESESMYAFIKGMHVKRKWNDFKDHKNFVPFIINRILSNNWHYVEVVDYVQKYIGTLSPEQLYNFYCNILPNDMRNVPYPKIPKKPNDIEVVLLAKHYEISKREAEQYLNTFTNQDKKELRQLYGFTVN